MISFMKYTIMGHGNNGGEVNRKLDLGKEESQYELLKYDLVTSSYNHMRYFVIQTYINHTIPGWSG